MATTEGRPCPSCGTWIAADNLACVCGFRARSEASAALASALVAWVAGGLTAVFVWAGQFAVCIWPLGVLAIVAGLYGVRCGLRALGRGTFDEVVGIIALLLCGAFFAVPVGLLLWARFR